ncbi:hypothetical protein L1887_07355 [Cichorium endivia]|nr:hypothetical protein L1887_07355 [Cichorium endivia]
MGDRLGKDRGGENRQQVLELSSGKESPDMPNLDLRFKSCVQNTEQGYKLSFYVKLGICPDLGKFIAVQEAETFAASNVKGHSS